MPTSPSPASPESLIEDLGRLQSYASELQRVIRAAESAAPAQASGRDASGAAEAIIDRTGKPTALRLADDWERRVDPADVGGALVEAYQRAVQQHLTAWSEDLERSGWRYDAREVDERAAAAAAPALFRAPVGFGAPRSIESLLEDVLGELDRSHRRAARTTQPPAPRSSAADAGRVSVQITRQALTGVHVDPEWARGTGAPTINGELAQALRTARLTAAQAPRRDPHHDRLDELFGEVINFMQAHRSEGARRWE